METINNIEELRIGETVYVDGDDRAWTAKEQVGNGWILVDETGATTEVYRLAFKSGLVSRHAFNNTEEDF